MQYLGMMGQDKHLISEGWVMAWLSSYLHVIVQTAIYINVSLSVLFWLCCVRDVRSWTLEDLA